MRYRRPKRSVVVDDTRGFAVTSSDFTSNDRALAESVARELDRVDPLPVPPCPHEGHLIDLPDLSQPPSEWLSVCSDCGKFV